MKRLILITAHPFRKRKNTFTILFSEAMAEGIRDTMKEMGYFSETRKKTSSAEETQKEQFTNPDL